MPHHPLALAVGEQLAASGLLVLLLAGCGGEAPPPPVADHAPLADHAPSPEEMGRIDQATEGLTHLLLDLGAALATDPSGPSVHLRGNVPFVPLRGNVPFVPLRGNPVEQAFAPDFRGRPFPTATGPASREVDWIERRSWILDGEPVPREAFLESLDAFLDRFAEIESVTFEVPASEAPRPGEIACRVRLAIVARDREGRRVWVRGEASVSGTLDRQQRWQISAFALESLGSLVALRELFNDVTEAAGLAAADLPLVEAIEQLQHWYPDGAAAVDVDRDGLVDLFVTGPERNRLYRNLGDGTFRGVADRRFGLAAQFADIDFDFDPDLYLANDYGGGNALLINQGGRFVDQAEARGVLHAAQSMGVSFGDYDGDGDLDLFVTNMSSTAAARNFHRFDGVPLRHREHLARTWSGHALFRNRGDGSFDDVTAEAGPFHGGWGWGGGFLDLDNDGWLDLHVPNGFFSGRKPFDARPMVFGTALVATQEDAGVVEDAMKAAFAAMNRWLLEQGASFAGWERDLVMLNRGGRFLDISGISGADSVSDGRAAVYADFDNDGDLDIFLRATHGPAHFLFRNELGQDRGWLRVALEGRVGARDAFGAVVRIRTPARTLTAAHRASNGYLAQSDPRLLFGLGEETMVEWIEVRWPSGLVERHPGPFSSGTSLRLVEGEDETFTVEEQRFDL